jgi:hypothetical protein
MSMNCPHSDSGWCLQCVERLNRDNIQLRNRLATMRLVLTPEQKVELEPRIIEADTRADQAYVSLHRMMDAVETLLVREGWTPANARNIIFNIAWLGATLPPF